MKWNRDPLASRILVNHVASALPCERKRCLFEHRSDLAGCKARKLGHLDSDFYGGKANGDVFGNFFAVSDTVFDVESDGVLDILDRFFVGVSLAVTALQRRAGDEIAI